MKSLRTKIFLAILALLALQCNKEREEYYETPTWAGKPIYATLEEAGKFSLYLKCVDRSTYLNQLKGSGFWTVFAPNDDAMKAYLERKGYSSIDDPKFTDEEANALVSYNMLYNKYVYNHLTDVLNQGWDTLMSIRKRTPYYTLFNREFYKGDSVWVVHPAIPNSFMLADRNYKYMPFFLSKMLSQRKLTSQDYELFFPSTTYSPYDNVYGNVQGARFVTRDMEVANGVVHEVDYVNEPLPNLEQVLAQQAGDESDDGYSVYKSLLDAKNPETGEPDFIQYGTQPEVVSYYQNLYPSMGLTNSNLFVKWYMTDAILNCERPIPIPLEDSNEEADGYTLFAPTNRAVRKFEQNVLDEYDYTVATLPLAQKYFFINAHMAQAMIWPSEYQTAKNASGVFLNGKGASGEGYQSVTKLLKPASNGFFFGIDDYVKSPYFETVYTEMLLRPNLYSYLYNSGLYADLLHCDLNSYYNDNFVVLLPNDDMFKNDGFTMTRTSTGELQFTHSKVGTEAGAALTRVNRLVRSHMFRRFANPTRNVDISTVLDKNFADAKDNCKLGNAYGGYTFAINDFGDMVRIKGNQLQMYGNYLNGEVVTATWQKEFMNGNVYTIDKMLQYSAATAVEYAEPNIISAVRQAVKSNPNISLALQYLELFASADTNTVEPMPFLTGNTTFCTLFLPDNNAIMSAYGPQTLEGSPAVGNNKVDSLMPPNIIKRALKTSYNAWGEKELLRAIKFFKYHMIPGTLYLDDGYSNMLFSDGLNQENVVVATYLKVGALNKSTFLQLQKNKGADNTLEAVTYKTGTLPVTPPVIADKVNVVRGMSNGEPRSNMFGPKVVIHEVDGFLRYVPEPTE